MATIKERNDYGYKIIDDNKNEVSLNYFHKTSDWTDLSKVEVFFFKNPYLQHEINIFDITIKSKYNNGRDGCIFPITAIESEDVKTNYLKNYFYLAFKSLVENISDIDESKSLISQYFDENLFILVLHKESILKKDNAFNIKNYIFSFASYGFYYLENIKDLSSFQVYKAYSSDFFDYTKTNLKITCGIYPTDNEEQYIQTLFSELLRIHTNILSRFIILYQVIELEIGKIQSRNIDSSIKDFENGKISLNDLKEKIQDASKEKANIQKLFDDYKIESSIRDNFYNECTSFYNDAQYPYEKNWCSVFYSLRNNLVHSFSKYMSHKEALDKTILAFEKVIINLVIKLHENHQI